MFKKISSLISLGTAISCLLVSTGSANPGEYGVSEHRYIGPEENFQQQLATQAIYTDFGEFVRVKKKGDFKEKEIARSFEEINSKTKELVFDYGVFIKK
ncbi:hypothetical protein FHS19_001732 [Paenibacillus rhizosphaerae]|uniref:Uncharacterized protein n=1 Tax=Paenibacillus rhizosphaerae TaxID=297318 RepID=A0A839TNS8_9BACL|nr:hypothetical protein [Paenibacillus rhizosphaerae]MBB3127078.1 hypothetical protein [Paenibacillus rhizosphaerae]